MGFSFYRYRVVGTYFLIKYFVHKILAKVDSLDDYEFFTIITVVYNFLLNEIFIRFFQQNVMFVFV